MSPADFLLTVAEISIALVGFSAIVIMFRRFAGGPESAFPNLQVSVIIEVGLMAVFLSLLPLLIGLFPMSEVPVWRSSSFLFALACALLMTSYVKRRAGLPVPAQVTQRGYMIRMAAVALVMLLQLLNAFLLPASSVAAVYCAGVVWLLVMVSWIFVGTWRMWGGPDADEA